MKKVTLYLTLILALIISNVVLAADATTQAEVAQVGNAEALINAVAKGGKIKLSDNIVLNTILDITNDVELDLNGFSVTPNSALKSTTGLVIVQNGGDLTINDSVGTGKISGGLDNDNLYGAVQLTKKDVSTEKTAILTVNGGTLEGYYYGVVGNGSRHNTSITINGGNIKGVNGVGIYHPQNGNITINNGNIEGNTGIEIRAGKLIVENGTITGTYKPTSVLPNGNGATTEGVGIAIVQHTTKLDTGVVVNSGTIKGFTSLYQSNPQKNDEDAIAKVSIKINGGKFDTINGGTVSIYSENKTKFINGGTFASDVSNYIADGVLCNKVNNSYVVARPSQEAEIPSNVANAEKVEEMLVETLKEVAKNNPELAEAIANNNVEIKVEMADKKDISSDEKQKIETAASGKVENIKIAGYVNITISVIKENGDKVGELEELKDEITFKISVPENLPEVAKGYSRVFYIIRNHNGVIDILETKEENGKLEFASDKFSTYAIAYKDVKNKLDTTTDEDNKVDTPAVENNKVDTPAVEDNKVDEEEVNNPQTGDNIVIYITIATIAIIGIIAINISKRKMNKH